MQRLKPFLGEPALPTNRPNIPRRGVPWQRLKNQSKHQTTMGTSKVVHTIRIGCHTLSHRRNAGHRCGIIIARSYRYVSIKPHLTFLSVPTTCFTAVSKQRDGTERDGTPIREDAGLRRRKESPGRVESGCRVENPGNSRSSLGWRGRIRR